MTTSCVTKDRQHKLISIRSHSGRSCDHTDRAYRLRLAPISGCPSMVGDMFLVRLRSDKALVCM